MHDHPRLREAIMHYFPAEKRESLLFMIVGITAIAVAVVLIVDDSPWIGMAYPLAAVGLIQIVVGGTVYFRTDRQTSRLLFALEHDPESTVREELRRMKTVNRGFAIYRWTEVALLAAGVIGLFLLRGSRFLWSAAIGLAVQAGVMLLLDFFAERRAARYVKTLRSE